MSESFEYSIGARARTSDDEVGRLTRVIVDPNTKAVTHLAIEPQHGHSGGRLVPIALAGVEGDRISLAMTSQEFEALEDCEAAEFVAIEGESWDAYYGIPYGDISALNAQPHPAFVATERLPNGEVDFRRGDPVVATDGPIGHIRGVAIDPDSHHIVYILLAEGHLWGHKEVAIPIGAVARVAGSGAHLSISKQDVADLPAINLRAT